jgi:UDP-glucuronate decarboxylase
MTNQKKQDHILLTGGTGFFGKALLRYWVEKAKNGKKMPLVTILSRDPRRFGILYPELIEKPWLFMHHGDITKPNTFPKKIAFTHVIHAAADSTLGPKLTPLERYDQIVDGTRNLLDFATSSGAKRFLFTSSGAVYGTQPPHLERITEDWHGMPDPLTPNNAYGVAKRAAEHLCVLYGQKYNIETVIARCFAFVGPDLPLDVHFALGNFIRDALWRDEITVSGDGTPLRSYLYQKDLADWLITLLNNAQSGQAYNVGSDQAISIAELAYLVRDIIAPKKLVKFINSSDLNKNRNIYIPSIQKAKNELKLEVKVSLSEAIRNTFDIINNKK